MTRTVVWSLILTGLLTPVCRARTIYVNAAEGNDQWTGLCRTWNGGTCGPKATISAAVQVAMHGDIVLVADGTYVGPGNRNISFAGKAITVRAEMGPALCIIDCERQGRAFHLNNSETPSSIIEGFTITHGLASLGGAVRCDFASPSIRDCVLIDNEASSYGGAVYCSGSHPRLRDCQFVGNTAGLHGGAVYGYISGPTLLRCTLAGNAAGGSGGGGYFVYNNPTVIACTIIANTAQGYGGGICTVSNSATINNSLITGNTSDAGGGGLCVSFANVALCTISGNRAVTNGGALFVASSGNSALADCILWADAAPTGAEISIPANTTLRIYNCLVQGGQAGVDVGNGGVLEWSDGSLSTDPLFVAPGHWEDMGTPEDPNDDTWVNGDYHLSPESPVIDAGDNDSVPRDSTDLDGDGNTTEPVPYDYTGGPRFLNDGDTADTGIGTPPIVDMGAYEFQPDCNGNGVPDFLDIAGGTSQDENGNGIADECEPKIRLLTEGKCFPSSMVVRLVLSDTQKPIVGGQFFMQYDAAKLQVVQVSPGDASKSDMDNPFERELFELVDPNAGTIDYAVGIPDGASGTTLSVPMAFVEFAVLDSECSRFALLDFREHFPTTRLSGELGAPIVPQTFLLSAITLDPVPPDLVVPPDVAIYEGEPTDPTHTGQATATDNCDPAPQVTYEDEVQADQILRTWTATDACGNNVQGLQTITILPCTVPGDVDCNGLLDANDFQRFCACLNGPDNPDPPPGCDVNEFRRADLESDDDVDLADMALLQTLFAN